MYFWFIYISDVKAEATANMLKRNDKKTDIMIVAYKELSISMFYLLQSPSAMLNFPSFSMWRIPSLSFLHVDFFLEMKKRKRRNEFEIWKLIGIKIRVLPTDTRSFVGKASARQAEDLGSNPSECQICYLFCCVLSSLLPLRSVGRSNFDNGLHNLITLIQKRHKIMIMLYYIMESTVDSYEHY